MPVFSPSATTRLLALLGDPVAHSLSPAFQNAAIRHHGLDAIYVALRCDMQSIGPLMRALAHAGGGGNVTVPHKAAAAQCIPRPNHIVQRTGACNAFWGEDGEVCGDNTDVAGFAHAARLLLPSLEGARVLVLGAGGAAAAAVCALIDGGAAQITLVNRSPDRAFALARRFDAASRRIEVVLAAGDLRSRTFDLATNASAAGMSDDTQPLDLTLPREVRAVLDLVYRRSGTTPWVREARRLGLPAGDGREMLLGQGAAAFERWFGAAAPLDVMRDAIGTT